MKATALTHSTHRTARRLSLVALATLASSPVSLAPLIANAGDMSAKVYGAMSLAVVSTSASTESGEGSKSSYDMYDNVSLLGVKGEAAVVNGTKFIYDYNAILDIVNGGGGVSTHLGIVGIDGSFGTVTAGRDNGLFVGMVDGGTYQTNWFFTPGMSALQVGQSIKYVTPSSSGFQAGVQAFDIGKDSTNGKATNNYTVAGTYGMNALTFGLGHTKYAEYANDGTAVTNYAESSDTSQFGEGTNSFSGVVLKNITGISAAYKADMYGVVAAMDSRKPNDGESNTEAINTYMITGNYAATKSVNLVANVSSTKQGDKDAVGGVKGTVVTLMAAYAPASNLMYTVEFQSSNKDANVSGITGATGADGTKSNTGLALGAMYAF